jgi:hypothetical protein
MPKEDERVQKLVYEKSEHEGEPCIDLARDSVMNLRLGGKNSDTFTVENQTGGTLVLRYYVESVTNGESHKAILAIHPFEDKIVIKGKEPQLIQVRRDCGIPEGESANGKLIPDCGCPHSAERAHTDWHIDC